MATSKEQRAVNRTVNSTAAQQSARAGRLKQLWSRGFEAKKVTLYTTGAVVLIVVAFTGYALFQKFSANASSTVSTAGYTYLGSDADFRYYMCRTGYTAVRGIVVSEVGEANYSFNAQLASMGSTSDVGDVKTPGSYANKSSSWNVGNALKVSMTGLEASSYMRILGFFSPTSGNLSENGYFNSAGTEVRNLKPC